MPRGSCYPARVVWSFDAGGRRFPCRTGRRERDARRAPWVAARGPGPACAGRGRGRVREGTRWAHPRAQAPGRARRRVAAIRDERRRAAAPRPARPAGIVGQTGQARQAGTGPVRKSTARELSGPESFVLVPGPCQAQCRAWAAIAARGPSTGTTR